MEFGVHVSVDDTAERLMLSVELPNEQEMLRRIGGETSEREIHLSGYEAICCGLLLRLTFEAYRAIPELDQVQVTGYFATVDAKSDEEVRAQVLCLATTRAGFRSIDLDASDMTVVFLRAGGRSRRVRGELFPLSWQRISRAKSL